MPMIQKIETQLKKKYGPLPLWGWLALIAVAVMLGLYLRARNRSVPVEPADSGGFVDEPIQGTDGGGSGGGGTGQTPFPEFPPFVPYPEFPEEPSVPSGGGGLPTIPIPQEVSQPVYAAPTTTSEAAYSTPLPATSTKSQDLSGGTLLWRFAACKSNPAKTTWKKSDSALFVRHINCRGFTKAEYGAKYPAVKRFFGW